ncbi:uncharacterized protein [Watersipora subatra]|uniref:uncharacterized protein n=1 Tax=Watersipora subatra TaxID=2589382 RepID=UPI00355C56BF
MPPKKKKRTQPKKVVKKPRGSSTKKKKAEDKPWKSSLKFESRETPDGSRSNTPSCYDNNGKSRNSSMTSRDFIRQVLEYDKASESDLESEECEDDDQSSDIELKMAIKDSLSNEENTIGVNVDQYSDSDNDDSILNDDSVLTNGEKTVSNDVGVDGDLDSTHDSSANFSQDAATSEPLSSSSVYAPMPEFLPDDMPTLKLPPSSDDLLIAKEYVLRAAGVYEILRVYGQILRLSPFIFEEFIASMTDVLEFEYNPLIHEVHSCLIKTLLREEDNNQTSFGPVDLKDSMNSLFFFNDAMTYPHVIREYLRSDSDKEFQLALGYISEPDYLNGAVEKKLNVLEVLCNLILSSNSIREELSADGFIKYEDHCRVCQKTGDVLCCDKCSGVYHLYCLDPPLDQLPEGDWACNVCSDSEVPGVTDCINSTEKRSMNRNDPLGFDRHWRKYWFLVRRIIIEDSNGDVTYVSTAKQFDRLLECLDEKWERQLVSVLRQRREEILEHMAITVHLTEERRGQRQSYLTKEDIELEKLQEEDLKETRDTKDAVNARNSEINNKPDTSDVVGKHNSVEKAGVSADDDQKASMKVATTVPGSQPVGDGGASVTIKTAVTPITLELSDFVGNQTAKLSRLLPNPDDKSTTTIENQDSEPTLSTQGQLQSVADNEPIAKTLADIEIDKSQGTDPEYLDIEMLQSDISTSEPVPEHLLVEEVATEEAVITEEFVVAEESVVTTDIAAETDVVKELIDQAASNESNARDLMEETQLYEGQDLDNEALDLQEGLALDEVEDVEANLGQTVVLGEVTASGIAADGVSDEKTQVIIGGNDADGCEDFMDEGLDEFSGESSDSEEDIPSDVDYFDNGLVNVIDEMNSSAEMSGDDELGSLESGEIGEEDEEGRVWSDSEMEGSDGDLGASDDGQVMDTDEEAGETSDSLDDMDELSRVDDENSALGYEDQLDGTVDSEVSDKNTVAASTQQQIIISTSASNIGQPKDTPIIIKTASGCQSIKLVNVSSGANGNYKAEVSGPVQKLGQADDVSTASSGTHAVKVLAVPQTKLVKTPTQGIVNLDKFGNIVGWGKNATAAIKQTIVSKVTGSQAGPAHVLKTYGKKPAVITVPVTATVDQYKSEHPSTQPSSEAAGLLNTVTTTVVTPQTLLTTIASPKSITLSTNAQTSANAKPTLQVLNVSPQTGNKSVTLVTPSSANQIVTIPSQMVSVGNQKLSASNHKVVVSNQKVLGTNQIVTLPNQGKLATNIEVIRNSAGMPIKLLRGTNSTGAVGTVVVSSNDGTKPPFTKVVQKIQQGSPSVSSHGGIMRIISDKSGKLSTSVKSTPQKILIGTASDGATVLKTQTGEAKVINLSGQTPGSFPGSQSQFAMKLVNKTGASVTSASIIRPIISAPIQRLVQPTLPKRLVQPTPLISKQVKPQIFTQGGQPRMIRPRKDENLTGGIVPQTVVLVDKDGKRSTVTVDARTLRNDAHTTLTTIQKKGSADELVSLRIVNDKAKVIPS